VPTSLGPLEIMMILLVALIVLGPSRLPEAGRQVGRALAEMRRWSTRLQDEVREALDAEPDPAPSADAVAPAELPRPAELPGPEQPPA
jgi:sec-independent protein translocase protein TatA